jgi:DNA-binding transcriptional LysR family regulator
MHDSGGLEEMEWDNLRFLLAVQRHGSLTGASRALHVDQTTVGRRLGSLQKEMRTRLFERNASGYRLTQAGIHACEIASGMEVAASALERQVAGRDVGIDGTVRITAPSGLVPVIAGALSALRRAHPGLTFHLLADAAVLNLLKGGADIALRASHPGQASLIAKKVARTPWLVFASKGYLRRRGVPAPGLAGHDVVGFDESLARTPGARWLAKAAPKANVVVRTSSVPSAVECAAADMGVVASPGFMAAHFENLERVLRPLVIETTNIYLVTHRDLAKVPRVRATLDALTDHLRRSADVLETGAETEG